MDEIDRQRKRILLTNFNEHFKAADKEGDLAKPVDWAIDDLLPSSSVIILAGPAKLAGKTEVLIHMAKCFALGTPFLGRSVRQGFVIYLALEDGRQRMQRRLAQHGINSERTPKIPLRVCYGPSGIAAALEFINEANVSVPKELARGRVSYLIADPMSEMIRSEGGLDENDAGDMTRFLSKYRELAQAAEITMLISHHFRKDGTGVRGSSAIEGASDGWWEYTNPTKEAESRTRRLLSVSRDIDPGVKETYMAMQRTQADTLFYEVDKDQVRKSQNSRVRQSGNNGDGDQREVSAHEARVYMSVYRAIADAKGEIVLARDLRRAVGGRYEAVKKAIDKLVANDQIECGDDGAGYRLKRQQRLPENTDLLM